MTEVATQLVGRTAELQALDRVLADVRAKRSCALELVGEPGIGKTRLLAELRARADGHGALVLAGTASELERELPFGLFVDALDDYVHGLEPRRLSALDDDDRAELAHVLPSMSAPGAGAAPARADERYRTHRAVRRLAETLAATAPLVLVLDDLHWADAGSIELLGALLRRPPSAAVLIAMAMRPRQVPERLSAALERAHGAGTLTRLELAALSEAEAGELLGESVGATATAALYAAGGGNPFYLQQLARVPGGAAVGPEADVSAAGLDVPRAVAAALTAELALLSAEGRRALEGAAVAGDPFEPELAAAAAGLPDATVTDALDELLTHDFVRATDVPRRFRFRHPLVRRAVYEAAPGGWRLGAHERCADALAARGAPAAARAHHVEHAGRLGDVAAVAVLREAAEAAVPRAPATAARLFGAALRLLPAAAPDRAELLGARATAHAAAGQFGDAHAALLEALDLLPGDVLAARVRLTAACAGLEHLLGRHSEAHGRLTAALGELEGTSPAEESALTLELAIDALYRMDYAAMREWAARSLRVARPLGDARPTATAAGLLALAAALDGAVPEAEASVAEAAALADALSDDELAPWVDHFMDVAAAELYLDRYAAADAHAERALAVARATGRGQVVPILFWSGIIRVARGRLGDAAEVLDTAVEIARLAGHAEGVAWNLFARSLVATAAGDVETALATAEEATAAVRGLDRSFPSMGCGIALTAALLPAGDAARAVEVLDAAAGGADMPSVPSAWQPAAFELRTRCLLALGRRDEAVRAADAAQALADRLGLRSASAMADRATAAVALAAGDARAAADRALAAAAAADEVGATVEAARARMLAGRALAAAGDAARAAAELERAASDLEACGALRARDEAERELGRLGRRRHRRTRRGRADGDGVEALTERELQVARLVVDRKTNPQIAAELFLSPKTVETHIRNLFHKLDVSSRVDVARAVERADRETREAREPAPR